MTFFTMAAEFTLIVPFYRNCKMLARQVEEWNQYPEGVKVMCVDDGSPEPALPIIAKGLDSGFRRNDVELYRILIDIEWNRGGARNLGATMATTDWIVQIDIDHILPADAARALLQFLSIQNPWYRFPRWRRGKADETRKKDQIPESTEYGEIHPHVDSYLIRRELYWKVGGYDEDYSGCLGGGNMFLRRLEKIAGPALILGDSSDPNNPKSKIENPKSKIRLEVYTRSEIKDASDWSLPRDKEEYSKRRRMKGDHDSPRNPLRFPWTQQL